MTSKNPENQLRAHLEAATPGPWEPGDVWLTAGLIYSDTGEQVGDGNATRCCYCHLGEPSWSGRANINGTVMPAHRHRNSEPYGPEHAVSSAGGGLVAYEGGGIVRSEDVQFVVSAREHVPALLAEVDRLRSNEAALRDWLPVLRRAVEALPAKCRYHDDTTPHGAWREACCDTGVPARRRALAEEALNALTKETTA